MSSKTKNATDDFFSNFFNLMEKHLLNPSFIYKIKPGLKKAVLL